MRELTWGTWSEDASWSYLCQSSRQNAGSSNSVILPLKNHAFFSPILQKHLTQTGRQADRQTDRQASRQAGRQTDTKQTQWVSNASSASFQTSYNQYVAHHLNLPPFRIVLKSSCSTKIISSSIWMWVDLSFWQLPQSWGRKLVTVTGVKCGGTWPGG
jgi:hypothetical protein